MAEKKSGLASISEGRSDVHRVDPRMLYVKPSWNGRDFSDPDNIQHVEELALSIAEIGVKDPLTVVWEDGKAWLVDGECRLRASLLAISRGAPLKTVPVRSEERGANDADLLFSQIIRNKKKPFAQMELARICKRLCDMGWQQNDIAAKSGVTPARISQLLDLLTMPEPIKQMVTNGQVSASMAQKVVAEHNPVVAVQVLQDAVATAEAEGKQRAMPKHVETPVEPAKRQRAVTVEQAVKAAFEASTVDWSEDEKDLVLIAMPEQHWLIVRELLQL
jgi:ParB family chromosome partitioning protein